MQSYALMEKPSTIVFDISLSNSQTYDCRKSHCWVSKRVLRKS